MQRRTFLTTVSSVVSGLAFRRSIAAQQAPAGRATGPQTAPAPVVHKKGEFKQGVTRGVFRGITSFEDMCRSAAELGIKGFDLIGPADWPMLKKYGLVPSMYQGSAGSIGSALNNLDNHARLEASLHPAIDEAAANGVPNII